MIWRCLGWVEPRHAPIVRGDLSAHDGQDVTDGVCSECRREMSAQLKLGQRVELVCYRRGGLPALVHFGNRLSAALRLRFARRLEDFTGYDVRSIGLDSTEEIRA